MCFLKNCEICRKDGIVRSWFNSRASERPLFARPGVLSPTEVAYLAKACAFLLGEKANLAAPLCANTNTCSSPKSSPGGEETAGAPETDANEEEQEDEEPEEGEERQGTQEDHSSALEEQSARKPARRAGAEATARLRASLDKVVGRDRQSPLAAVAAPRGKTEEIREELNSFLNAAVSARETRAADFWDEPAAGGRGEGKKCYPNLYRGARHFLCLSASNARVERFFSAGQQLLEPKRRAARFSDDTPGELLLLHANGRTLGLP